MPAEVGGLSGIAVLILILFGYAAIASLLLERFHDWHRRMGMEHSPLDHFRCC